MYEISTEKSTKSAFLHAQREIENLINAGKVVNGKMAMDSDANLYLSNALERVDPFLYKPLIRFYWQDFVPIMYGGGALETESFYRTNYNTSSENANAASGSNNIIAEITATIEKHQTIVKSYCWSTSVNWVDELKLAQVGSSILDLQLEGVRNYYNQKLDDIAFFGMVKEGNSEAYGLFNNPNIATDIASKTFDASTPKEIYDTLNNLLYSILTKTEFSKMFPVNTIALPPASITTLLQPMAIGDITGDSGKVGIYTTVLEYFKRNNITKSMLNLPDDSIAIMGCPYLEGAGASGSKRRAVAYCYDMNTVRLPLPMDLTRGAQMFDPNAMATKVPFVAFIGQPQFIYTSTLGYLDNI